MDDVILLVLLVAVWVSLWLKLDADFVVDCIVDEVCDFVDTINCKKLKFILSLEIKYCDIYIISKDFL